MCDGGGGGGGGGGVCVALRHARLLECVKAITEFGRQRRQVVFYRNGSTQLPLHLLARIVLQLPAAKQVRGAHDSR